MSAAPRLHTRPTIRRTALRQPTCQPQLERLEARDVPTAFGGDGIVTTNLGGTEQAEAIAVQPDGKIVAVATAPTGGAWTTLAVMRYRTDGTLDPTFSGDGKDISIQRFIARDVAIAPDGKIVVAGVFNGAVCAVVRYNANGTLDTTFSGDGMATADVAGQVRAVAVQLDGKIVVVGRVPSDLVLVRFKTDGELDEDFGVEGKVTTSFFISTNSQHRDIAIQPDGKIVVVAAAQLLTNEYAVIRFTSNGTPDPDFGGGDGVVYSSFTTGVSGGYLQSVAIQPDGKIVAAGNAYDSSRWSGNVLSLARYDSAGVPDGTFGTDGMVFTNLPAFNQSIRSGLTLDPDGRIFASVRGDMSFLPNSTVLVCLNPLDGSYDESFGVLGKVTDITGGPHAGVAAQSDGKILLGGGLNGDVRLARFYGETGHLDDGSQDPPPAPTLSIGDVSLSEGNAGTTTATFIVTRSGSTADTVTVDFATADNTATVANNDYTATSGILTFAPGVTTQTLAVTIHGDTVDEGNEAFFVNLTNATGGATISDNQGVGTLVNDDAPVGSTDIYVWDIVFESRNRGSKHDERVLVTIRQDSDADGVAESSDALVASASVTVVVTGPTGATFSGTTITGTYTSPWISDVPNGTYTAEVTALSKAGLFWNRNLDPTGNDTDVDSDNFPDQQHTNPHGPSLLAESIGSDQTVAPLTKWQSQSLLWDAIYRLAATGMDVGGLANVTFRIADLPGATLGLVSGNTIWLDADAAGWGWFVDATPRDDREFATPGNQGEQGRIDLLTVIAHELGHLLGHDHDDAGVMAATLAPGVRHLPAAILPTKDLGLLDAVFALERRPAGAR